MKLKRGASSLWALLYRIKLARPRMPFWRVVVEAKLDRRAKAWPERFNSAVAAVFVWARTIEEAEALASLAIEQEGMIALTADAIKHAPASAPRREPAAMARTAFGFLPRLDAGAIAGGAPHRDARA